MEVSKQNKKVHIFAKQPIHNQTPFHGEHILLELYGCNSAKLNDEIYLRCQINQAAKLAQATVLNLVSNKFEPYGVTAIALLAESHISIHTWPESHYSAIDIFTCGRNMRPYLASQFLIEQLESKNHLLKTINRDYPISIEHELRRTV